jgi:hypothetical protein
MVGSVLGVGQPFVVDVISFLRFWRVRIGDRLHICMSALPHLVMLMSEANGYDGKVGQKPTVAIKILHASGVNLEQSLEIVTDR